jgi:YbgC/YbaW family acyl-CoA thioester hydrolase
MFKTEAVIRFHDADAGGVIFFANLLKHAHDAYEELLKNLNLQRNYFFDDDYLLPIIHAEADYKKPVKAGDRLIVVVTASDIRKNSFELSYDFLDEDNQLMAFAKTVHTAVDKKSFTKTSLPEELRRELKTTQD